MRYLCLLAQGAGKKCNPRDNYPTYRGRTEISAPIRSTGNLRLATEGRSLTSIRCKKLRFDPDYWQALLPTMQKLLRLLQA